MADPTFGTSPTRKRFVVPRFSRNRTQTRYLPFTGISTVVVATALSSSAPQPMDKKPDSPPWTHSAGQPPVAVGLLHLRFPGRPAIAADAVEVLGLQPDRFGLSGEWEE